MSEQSLVRHPLDLPAVSAVDFWAWRWQRRLSAQWLRALQEVALPSVTLFAEAATAVERETLTPRLAEQLTIAVGGLPSDDMTWGGLLRLIMTAARQRGVRPHTLPSHGAIRPDWEQIPVGHARFVGTVDGSCVAAELVPGAALVPSYALLWTRGPDDRLVVPVDTQGIGPHRPYTAAVWDWLVARRLHQVCQWGGGTWPGPGGPVVIPGDWALPDAVC